MKSYRIAILFFFLIPGLSFSSQKPIILLTRFDYLDIENPEVVPSVATNADIWFEQAMVSNFEVILKFEKKGKKNTSLERAALAQTNKAEAVLEGLFYYFDQKYVIRISAYSEKTGELVYEDETYTSDLGNPSGLRKAVQNLSDRFFVRYQGEEPAVYSELSNVTDQNDESNYRNANPSGEFIKRVTLVSLGGGGYSFPVGGEVKAIQAWTVWLNAEGFPGVGVGSELARIFLNYPAQTNITGTILPLQIWFPLYVNRTSDQYQDWFLTAEWAWYSPVQTSGPGDQLTSTNTNVSSIFNPPMNYLELAVRYYPFPFTEASAGVQYFYSTGSVYFYAGASFYLGFYKKE